MRGNIASVVLVVVVVSCMTCGFMNTRAEDARRHEQKMAGLANIAARAARGSAEDVHELSDVRRYVFTKEFVERLHKLGLTEGEIKTLQESRARLVPIE